MKTDKRLWKCPYIDQSCGTHGLCAKCRPVITAMFLPSHTDEFAKVHFQTTPQYVEICRCAMEEMLSDFLSRDMIRFFRTYIE